MSETNLNQLKKLAIRLDQEHRNGKIILSTLSMAQILALICKAIEEK